jgi:hypothetical protein
MFAFDASDFREGGYFPPRFPKLKRSAFHEEESVSSRLHHRFSSDLSVVRDFSNKQRLD